MTKQQTKVAKYFDACMRRILSLAAIEQPSDIFSPNYFYRFHSLVGDFSIFWHNKVVEHGDFTIYGQFEDVEGAKQCPRVFKQEGVSPCLNQASGKYHWYLSGGITQRDINVYIVKWSNHLKQLCLEEPSERGWDETALFSATLEELLPIRGAVYPAGGRKTVSQFKKTFGDYLGATCDCSLQILDDKLCFRARVRDYPYLPFLLTTTYIYIPVV